LEQYRLLPVRSADSLGVRNRKTELERRIVEVDEAVKVFERPRVFVKLGEWLFCGTALWPAQNRDLTLCLEDCTVCGWKASFVIETFLWNYVKVKNVLRWCCAVPGSEPLSNWYRYARQR